VYTLDIYILPEPSKQNRLVGPPYPTKLVSTNVKLYLLIDAVNILSYGSGEKGKKLVKRVASKNNTRASVNNKTE